MIRGLRDRAPPSRRSGGYAGPIYDMATTLREFLRVTGEKPDHGRERAADGRQRPVLPDDCDDGADLVGELHALLARTARASE